MLGVTEALSAIYTFSLPEATRSPSMARVYRHTYDAMRLLYTTSDGRLNCTDDLIGDKIPAYAILSHIWEGQEVAFKDLKNHIDMKDVDTKLKGGYQKLFFCAQQVKQDGLNYFWVDTCCIDKSNNRAVGSD